VAEDVVWALDVSRSMGRSYETFRPSKLSVAKEAIAYASGRLLERRGYRVGLVVFHGRAVPVLHPTDSIDMLLSTLAMINSLGEGSAGGDAVAEAVKMVRRSGRKRRVVMVTDAGFNTGIPLPIAAVYARNAGVVLEIVTIGARPGEQTTKMLQDAATLTGGSWRHAQTQDELYKILLEVVGIAR
jgi:Ca-activated chloride channel family protein